MRACAPASFLLENTTAVSSFYYVEGKVRSFIILPSIVGRLNLLSKDKNYNNRVNFSSEKSTMKLSRVYIFLKNMEKPKSRPHR